MISQTFEYSAPANLEEALGLLSDQSAKALAGGMSLIPLMKLRLAAPGRLVDLRHLSDLNFIREEAGALKVGALTTHRQIQSSPLLRGKCPLLSETADNIGDMQVRNMGTIGGSIAHADPAADYPAALLALEATIRIAGAKSERTVSISDFFVDTFTTSLEPGELICDFTIPIEDGSTGVAYRKVVQPASGFAIVGIAVRVRKSGGLVSQARIGVTGLASKAFRALAVEKILEGSAGSEQDIEKAADVVANGVEVNSDLFGSAEYRRHLAKIHTARALKIAVSRTA